MHGRSGIVNPKFEGDGGTPTGLFHMREVRYRADRLITPPHSGLPVFKAKATDGWCDDPEDMAYNRIVTLPYQSDAEPMWRDDHLYDVLGVIGYNDAPVVAGAGSAIFLHVMRPPTDDHQYTAGCVSLKMEDVLAVLAKCTPSTMIDIRAVAWNRFYPGARTVVTSSVPKRAYGAIRTIIISATARGSSRANC
jgi:L,D-peptidoglycan transpeptidase YkuD (ErfK/YbiS/YcfS/YnhG family)